VGLAGQYHPPGFAAWTTPEWVIISGDNRSNRPQVSDAYRARGATVLNTSLRGAVKVTVARNGFQVSSWRSGPSRQPIPPWGELSGEEDDPTTMPD
jgi:hypothetical protein